MNAIFVDTGIWYAYANSADHLHARAMELLQNPKFALVTSWPVVWEVVTLMGRQLGGRAAATMGMELVSQGRAKILELESADYALAFDLMARFQNVTLSAADATACAIIRRLNIPQVYAFDEHFRIVLSERIVVGKS